VDEIRELAPSPAPDRRRHHINETHLVTWISGGIATERPPGRGRCPAAQGGVAVLNYDDPRVRAMAARTRAQVVTYGLTPDADLVAGAVEAGPEGTSFTVFVKDFFPVPGLRANASCGCRYRCSAGTRSMQRWPP